MTRETAVTRFRVNLTSRGALCRVVALILTLCCCPVQAQSLNVSRTHEFLEGLRVRRLFELAQHYCDTQLASPGLSSDDRAHLVVEQIRNYALHAMNAGSADRGQLWAKARATAAAYVARYQQNTRRLVVRFQHAVALQSRFESMPKTRPLPERLKIIREAIRELETISREVRRTAPRSRSGLSEEEKNSLQNHVALRLPQMLLSQARMFPPGHDNRIALVNEAANQLKKLDARLSDKDKLKLPLRIELAIALRMNREAGRAQRLLVSLLSPSVTGEIRQRIVTEQIRTEIAAGNADGALRLAQTQEVGTSDYPDRELAALEAVLAKWQAAGGSRQPKKSDRWKALALDFVKRIDQQHGPYWGRQADQVLIASIPRGSVTSSTDIEILLRAADNLVRKRSLVEAIGAYESAAKAAAKVENDALRFRALFLAARVCEQQKKPREFFNRLRTLALELKTYKDSASAHLLAVRQSYKLARQDPKTIVLYETTLQEHLRHWPNQATVAEAAWRLGQLHRVNRRWSDAVDVYSRIPGNSSFGAVAVEQLATCWEKSISELQAKDNAKELQAEVNRATRWFRDRYLVKAADGMKALPNKWHRVARLSVLAEAKITLRFAAGGQVRQALLAARDGLPVAEQHWLAQAEIWLVAAAVAEQNVTSAATHARQVSAGQPVELLALLSWLHRRTVIDKSKRMQLGQLAVQITRRVAGGSASWSKKQQQELLVHRARALEAVGKRAAAIQLYREIAKAEPRNAGHQERLAAALLKSMDARELKESLNKWRHLGRFSQVGTERWFRAKYSIALAEFKLGNKKRAGQLIRFLQATPPGFTKSKLKDQFLALLKRCEP